MLQVFFIAMLTKNNIKHLKTELEVSLSIINEMIREKQYQALFDSEEDFRRSKEARKICPDDYYKFRAFDVDICLKVNHRLHRYYIHFDCINLNFPLDEFRKTFKSDFDYDILTSNRIDDDKYNFVFIKEYAFEECENVFYKVVAFYVKHKIHSDKLFEIY